MSCGYRIVNGGGVEKLICMYARGAAKDVPGTTTYKFSCHQVMTGWSLKINISTSRYSEFECWLSWFALNQSLLTLTSTDLHLNFNNNFNHRKLVYWWVSEQSADYFAFFICHSSRNGYSGHCLNFIIFY